MEVVCVCVSVCMYVCVCVYVCARRERCDVGSDHSDGCSVVALHLDPGHHLQHCINPHALPDRENKTLSMFTVHLILVEKGSELSSPPQEPENSVLLWQQQTIHGH